MCALQSFVFDKLGCARAEIELRDTNKKYE